MVQLLYACHICWYSSSSKFAFDVTEEKSLLVVNLLTRVSFEISRLRSSFHSVCCVSNSVEISVAQHFASQSSLLCEIRYKVDVIILYDLCYSVCVNKNELEVDLLLLYTIPHSLPPPLFLSALYPCQPSQLSLYLFSHFFF